MPAPRSERPPSSRRAEGAGFDSLRQATFDHPWPPVAPGPRKSAPKLSKSLLNDPLQFNKCVRLGPQKSLEPSHVGPERPMPKQAVDGDAPPPAPHASRRS